MYKITYTNKFQLDGLAKCHKACFQNSLSTRLGRAYIKKTFEWFLVNPNRFLFHIEKDGEVVGYCGGFVPKYIGDGSTSGMMQYAMPTALTGALLHPWLLFNKEVMALYPLIFKNIRQKLFGKRADAAPLPPVGKFEKRLGLVVIGVHPSHRGSGIFTSLMEEFENKARSFNLNKLVLSVKKNNTRAIKAYTKQGWFIVNEHAPTYEMCKYL